MQEKSNILSEEDFIKSLSGTANNDSTKNPVINNTEENEESFLINIIDTMKVEKVQEDIKKDDKLTDANS